MPSASKKSFSDSNTSENCRLRVFLIFRKKLIIQNFANDGQSVASLLNKDKLVKEHYAFIKWVDDFMKGFDIGSSKQKSYFNPYIEDIVE